MFHLLLLSPDLEEILPAQAFVFFVAGFETSSSAMGNCLTELSFHRDVQDRARAEVDKVLAKHNGEITYEALHDMTYLQQVIEGKLGLLTVIRI